MPKGKKKVKLTEEQKIHQEEQKMLLQIEMKRKKEEILMQYLKDKHAKEEKFTKLNNLIINDRWRGILREIKGKEIKSDIVVLKNTFDRIVDQKDEIFKALLVDIEEAEEQYIMALSSHLENIDRFIELQKERLQNFQLEYDKDLCIVKEEFDKEREKMLTMYGAEMNDLADIMYAMEQHFIEKEMKAKSDFDNLKDEVRNKNLEEKHSLRVSLESKVEHLWMLFNQTKAHYHETTEERKEAFEKLKKKDAKSSEEIEKQMRKVQRIAEQIGNLKVKMAYNAKVNEEKNRKLREEKDKMRFVLQGMKIEMNKLRTMEFEKLTRLALESNDAISKLTRQRDKGVKILKLFERCRKLETEREKVLPFYPDTIKPEEIEKAWLDDHNPCNKNLQKMMDEYKPLTNFWKRFNKVLLDKRVLIMEHELLARDNEKLRYLLKQYLDGISVSSDVLSQTNPLFIVHNSRTIANALDLNDPRVKKKSKALVSQEAALIVKNILT
ncbi:dynein regulatory complex subunit 2 [Octopus bimaculoides]|uniref:Dynein regulatory complex subunit 2 n=1 Tax=Octopus bimaculoides TaxID=37653 RepID=A0A0L8H393_OCTBM|nr:dynein regulatory complex subunit 2 [Octopus bimaculoides]|eukprot:XP_014776106.1 PREDICTED: coiled-coil domain-containing protein 65-like isoform X1 [Octopus bimaculoides]